MADNGRQQAAPPTYVIYNAGSAAVASVAPDPSDVYGPAGPQYVQYAASPQHEVLALLPNFRLTLLMSPVTLLISPVEGREEPNPVIDKELRLAASLVHEVDEADHFLSKLSRVLRRRNHSHFDPEVALRAPVSN